jgi:hypothetical protein
MRAWKDGGGVIVIIIIISICTRTYWPRTPHAWFFIVVVLGGESRLIIQFLALSSGGGDGGGIFYIRFLLARLFVRFVVSALLWLGMDRWGRRLAGLTWGGVGGVFCYGKSRGEGETTLMFIRESVDLNILRRS